MRLTTLRPAAVAAVLAAALLTSGCASDSGKASRGTPSSAAPSSAPAAAAAPPTASTACATSGTASDAVKVTGSGTAEPKVTFPVPTTASRTERTVITKGTGDTVRQGMTVALALALYDAKSGRKAQAGGFGTAAPTPLLLDKQVLAGVVEAVQCTRVGERFAAVIPSAKAFGATGAPQLGIQGGDPVVLVGDVRKILPKPKPPLPKATGTPKALPSGFPKVSLAASGQPTIAIPATDPPKKLRIATAKVGDGETVQTGDTVTTHYQGVLWRDGKVFDQSWGGEPRSFPTTGVVKGFGKALVGAKVGSQVVAIIPPADGYGPGGSPQGGIKGTDTLVFVIDILATSRA